MRSPWPKGLLRSRHTQWYHWVTPTRKSWGRSWRGSKRLKRPSKSTKHTLPAKRNCWTTSERWRKTSGLSPKTFTSWTLRFPRTWSRRSSSRHRKCSNTQNSDRKKLQKGPQKRRTNSHPTKRQKSDFENQLNRKREWNYNK